MQLGARRRCADAHGFASGHDDAHAGAQTLALADTTEKPLRGLLPFARLWFDLRGRYSVAKSVSHLPRLYLGFAVHPKRDGARCGKRHATPRAIDNARALVFAIDFRVCEIAQGGRAAR